MLLVVIGTLLSDVFLSPRNIGNVLTNVTPLLLIAVGQTFVIGAGGLDLSVGVTATLSATLVATLTPEIGLLAVPAAVGAAVVVGIVNGAGVRWGLNPFLMTLASLSVVQGVIFTYRTSPGGTVPEWLTQVAGSVGPLPIALPIAVVVAGGAAFVVNWTRLGSHLLASGGHPGAGPAVGHPCGPKPDGCLHHLLGAGWLGRALSGGQDPHGRSTHRTVLHARFSRRCGTRWFAARGRSRHDHRHRDRHHQLGLLPNVLNLTAVPYFYQQPVKGLLLIAAVLVPAVTHQVQQRRRRMVAAERIARATGGT